MILISPVKDKVQGKYRDLFNWSEMLLTFFSCGVKEGSTFIKGGMLNSDYVRNS